MVFCDVQAGGYGLLSSCSRVSQPNSFIHDGTDLLVGSAHTILSNQGQCLAKLRMSFASSKEWKKELKQIYSVTLSLPPSSLSPPGTSAVFDTPSARLAASVIIIISVYVLGKTLRSRSTVNV